MIGTTDTVPSPAEPEAAPSRDAWVDGLIERLTERITDTPSGGADRAAASQLKRAAGATLAERPSLCPLFYRLAYDTPRWAEDRAFLVATLMPLGLRQDSGKTVMLPPAVVEDRSNLGVTFHCLRRHMRAERPDDDGSSLDKRLSILLDAPAEALPFRLRQAARFALLKDARDAGVDWARLLRDVLAWEHPSRFVQKQWARDYFGRAEDTPPVAPATNASEIEEEN